MSRIRTGVSITPSQSAAGTDGSSTLPRVLTFKPYTRPCMVWNNTGNGRSIIVKLNATDATDFGGGSDDGAGYFSIPDGSSVEVSLGGLLCIDRVSFITTNSEDDLDDVEVHGWSA